MVFYLVWLVAAGGAALAGGQPTVTVDGQATLRLKPELGVLTVGVITRAATAEQAAKDNAADMNRVLAALKRRLAPRDRLESAGYRLRPRTRWNKQQQRNEVIGYQASHRVRLTSHDPKALGGLLDAAVKAGANSIQGPRWELADPSGAQRKALAAAFAQAKARARALAQAAGLRLGPVLRIKTGPERGPRFAAAPRLANAKAGTPLEPGLVEVSAEVSCVFTLQPGL
jgi:uncharacterized protein YggE